MEQDPSSNLPTRPKLRPVDPQWVDHQGQRFLFLRDPMSMAKDSILIPQPLTPMIAMCDGTRDIKGLQSGLMLRSGIRLTEDEVVEILTRLDEALLLENGSFQVALKKSLDEYRQASHRPPSHADLVYPSKASELSKKFEEYEATITHEIEPLQSTANLAGMLCPHIDYSRGHKTYAELWRKAAPALEGIELAIILGTDHYGGLGTLTPTRQSYATPHGVMPTDKAVVDGLADVLGHDRAFSEEIHHLNEHSIELASVWFHHFIKDKSKECQVVPILCGSFHHYITGEGEPNEDEKLGTAIEFLKNAAKDRKTLVIAAGDLAHVGPAFGDPKPWDAAARAKLKADDEESLNDICNGDSKSFFNRSRQESDARKICGLSPIYLMLELLGDVRGEHMGYDQCSADPQGGSLVSIAGALLYKDS